MKRAIRVVSCPNPQCGWVGPTSDLKTVKTYDGRCAGCDDPFESFQQKI